MGKKRRVTPAAAPPDPAEPSDLSPSRLTYWFAPNLSMAVTLAATYYCAFLFFAPETFFADADAGWHIRAGEWMLEHGRVPANDIFSYLAAERWFAWEWLAEIGMAAVHSAWGLTGIVYVYILVVGLSIWLWFRLHWRLGGNFLLACAMAAPFLSAVQIHWLARPHLLSFVLLPGTIFLMERAGGRFTAKHAGVCFAVSVLWTNVHGSFVVGIGLACLYAAGHAIHARLRRDAASGARAKWCALAAIAGAAGTLVNPYGIELHHHVLRMTLLEPEMHFGIAEWEPYRYDRISSLPVMATIVVSAAGTLASWRQGRFHRALAMAALTILALKMARGIPVNAIVSLPLANAALTEALGHGWRGFQRISAAFSRIDSSLSGSGLALPAALALLWWLNQPAVVARTGFTDTHYPVRAVEAALNEPEQARIFADIRDGGLMIYRSEGRRKVWMDPRVDYFGPERLRLLHGLLAAAPGWQESMSGEGFTHALVRHRAPLSNALQRAGWTKLAEDSLGALYRRP